MEIKGNVYRKGRQWKIELLMDEWILNDMLEDALAQQRTVVTVFDPANYPPSQGGQSIYSDPNKTHLLGTVMFEEKLDKEVDK